MKHGNFEDKLAGVVEVNDAYIGGRREARARCSRKDARSWDQGAGWLSEGCSRGGSKSRYTLGVDP